MGNIEYGTTQDTIVINKRGLASPGYMVEITFPEFDEVHEIKVESLETELVKAEAEKLYAQRKAIADLNEPAED